MRTSIYWIYQMYIADYIMYMVSWIYSESQMVTNLTKKKIFDNK